MTGAAAGSEASARTEADAGATGGRQANQLLITVSATYGSGGSVVAPTLAGRLGVPCLHRVTTSEGGLRDAMRPGERLSAGEARRTPVHHLLASLTHALPAGPTQSPPTPHHQGREIRRQAEAEVHDLVRAGGGVILGRAAAVILGKERGYHVRLDGPPDRRVAQGAAIEHISQEQSRVHLEAADRARTAYVRRLYGVDPADARLYHLVIDSTAVPIDAVVQLILAGARAAVASSGSDA